MDPVFSGRLTLRHSHTRWHISQCLLSPEPKLKRLIKVKIWNAPETPLTVVNNLKLILRGQKVLFQLCLMSELVFAELSLAEPCQCRSCQWRIQSVPIGLGEVLKNLQNWLDAIRLFCFIVTGEDYPYIDMRSCLRKTDMYWAPTAVLMWIGATHRQTQWIWALWWQWGGTVEILHLKRSVI